MLLNGTYIDLRLVTLRTNFIVEVSNSWDQKRRRQFISSVLVGGPVLQDKARVDLRHA
jgi:hypothetical protein